MQGFCFPIQYVRCFSYTKCLFSMQAEQTQRLQDDYTTKRKNLLINMTKLQSGTLVGLQNEATDLDTARNVDNVSRLSVKVGNMDESFSVCHGNAAP